VLLLAGGSQSALIITAVVRAGLRTNRAEGVPETRSLTTGTAAIYAKRFVYIMVKWSVER
jgi:hypothetical protein